jgi:uncharacterized protein YjbJ (UPF0337 family)
LKTGAIRCPEHRPKMGQLIEIDSGGLHMNEDVFKGKWKELRGQVKEWWGKLTDDELEQAGGNAEQIVGLLQQKYGYTREQAVEEFNQRIKEVKEIFDKD